MPELTKEILDKVFKSYDIRGLVDTQLNEGFFYLLGKALGELVKDQPILIGHDARLKAPQMAVALAEGVLDQGGLVWWAGLMPSEVRPFSLLKYDDLVSAVSITASHNPAEYIGAKVMRKSHQSGKVIEFSKKVGYDQLKKLVLEYVQQGVEYRHKLSLSNFLHHPRVRDIQDKIKYDFKQFILNRLHVDQLNTRLKFVVDAGNGVAGKWFDYIFKDINMLEYIPLYFEPDGSFPHHLPNPSHKKNVLDAIDVVKKQNLDFGAVFDGDADRIMFVDKKGRRPIGHILGTILAIERLKEQGAGVIVQDVCLVFPARHELPKYGGKVLISPTGHTNVKSLMEQHNALFGFEASAHFLHSDFANMDSGFLSFVRFVNFVTQQQVPLEEVFDYYETKYPYLPETNFRVADRDSVIAAVEDKYRGAGTIDKTDGVAVEGANWRFSVRKSNTEPLVRLFAEATDRGTLEKVVKDVTKFLKQFEDGAEE